MRKQKNFTPEEIQELLKKINKTKKEHELNCGACGYQTCRAKAAAVYNGLSNIYTCLPYMNDLAEKMNEKKADVVKKLISMGMPCTINKTIDADTFGTLRLCNHLCDCAACCWR